MRWISFRGTFHKSNEFFHACAMEKLALLIPNDDKFEPSIFCFILLA